MSRFIAYQIIKTVWAEKGRDDEQSIKAYVENRISKQSRDEAAEEGRNIYLHRCATEAAEQVEREKRAEKRGRDLIDSAILDAWKEEGGIYKQAAEEVEADLEQEELDAIECPVSQSRVCATCGAPSTETNRVIDGMCGLCLACLMREEKKEVENHEHRK